MVQILNHFLIGRGQHRRVACEKTVKVFGISSTLLREGGRGGMEYKAGGDLGRGRVGMDRSGWIKVGWGVEGEENKRRGGMAG